MSNSQQDSSQWLSVTEETLFLHDGLIRVTDLVELPIDVNDVGQEQEVITFDSKSPSELSERLKTVCGTQNNAYAKLLEYRLNALKGFWFAQKQLADDEQKEREEVGGTEETIALLKKQGLWKETEHASFSTRISVLLVLPLLQSQSKFDLGLSGTTATVLLGCLRDCPPLSLQKEPPDCLNGLENLLCSWMGEGGEEGVKDERQKQNIASTLVALACARGHLKTLIHTVHLLQSLPDLQPLPVGDVLTKLLKTDGGQSQTSSVLGAKHILCWGFEDMLTGTEKDGDKEKPDENDIGRRITSDGKFLYTTNSSGRGISKLGTGMHGTLRGYIYARNPNPGPGFLAWADGQLYFRPLSYDSEKDDVFLQILDKNTLQVVKTLPRPDQYLNKPTPFTTIAVTTDGLHLYWVWCAGVVSDKNGKGIDVVVEKFKVEDQVIIPLSDGVKLVRKEEGSNKSVSDSLLSRLRPCRTSTQAATLIALTGGAETSRKDEQGSTSCGIALKHLIKTPVYCDGSAFVMLTTAPGSSSSNASRSLFGGGGTLSGLRILGSNLIFNLSDGAYVTRADIVDAVTCGLARGAPVLGLGVCYDVANNMLWTCSSDWVDQFFNPGHQARHHILRLLGISQEPSESTLEVDVPPSRVIKNLLQHAGSLCIHQLSSDILQTPLGSFLMQQSSADPVHLNRVADILELALRSGDLQTIHCIIMVVQLACKLNVFKKEKDFDIVCRLRDLLWRTVNTYQKVNTVGDQTITDEACRALCIGINVFYPGTEDRNNIVLQLLTEGEDQCGMKFLRELVLTDYAEQLRNSGNESELVKKLRCNLFSLNSDFVVFSGKPLIETYSSTVWCVYKNVIDPCMESSQFV